MNEDTIKGRWKQLRGKVQSQWGKLTDDDLDRIQGDTEQAVGRLQERYGIAKEQARKEWDDFCKTCGPR